MSTVAIIPARGGSKRLPRKNILSIANHPMLYYPIKAAMGSNIFDQIIVSTEDSEISSVAQGLGARVIQRPSNLAQDSSTVVQVCEQVLNKLKEEDGLPDLFCCLYATAIFITSRDLVNSFIMMDKTPVADFVMGVSEYNLLPFQALQNVDGYLKPIYPEYITLQSQNHPQLVASNGMFYWAKTDSFMRTKLFYGDRLKGYKIDKHKTVDINEPEDLLLAKSLLEANQATDVT